MSPRRSALIAGMAIAAVAASSHVAAAAGASYGSGSFGRWATDRFDLPYYRYSIDPATAPQARQPELGGDTDAWHQLGNDHVVATAHNEGHVKLWSQDRAYQFTNQLEPDAGHFSGGYGYLRTADETISTLYADRPPGARTRRDFGSGYFHRSTESGPAAIGERVYAPFGNAPLLIHEVRVKNTSEEPLRGSWFEYWDVNPVDVAEGHKTHLGLSAPSYSAGLRTLSAAEQGVAAPLELFASALRGRVSGWETRTQRFFGAGGRARPDAVAAGELGESVAPPVAEGETGSTMFALQSPVAVKPGRSVTLRYAYGAAEGDRIPRLVKRWRRARAPFARSQHRWSRFAPRAELGAGNEWLARELKWDAYMLRSGTTYDEGCGRHIVSQGGYYQYDFGWQAAFRDPLQHVIPLIYASPRIAADVLLYSAGEQSGATGEIPYGLTEGCQPLDRGTSNDLDVWLMLTAAEYGLATRDLELFERRVRFRDGGEATLWKHLKRAFEHQESIRGPHGGYEIGDTAGDWSDLSPEFLGMTESILVSAQLAYIYPRLAQLAALRGDRAFAQRLRATADDLRQVLRAQWTGEGWFSRGYAEERQLGRGVIYGEPQPWGLLAGAVNGRQTATLVANIRRFLTGIDAPPQTHGPARIGSSQSPARNDPAVTERTEFAGVGGGNAVFVGGVWYAVNGWLTWALGELDGVVPKARRYAFDELRRNTLAAHAEAYPDHWNGVISVDDVCFAHYASDPSSCGIGFTDSYNTQIMHQPAWSLFDAVKLAGVDPTRRGYEIDPHLPMKRFSLRLPRVGVSYAGHRARGYVRTSGTGSMRMAVALPEDADPRRVAVRVGGRRVRSRVSGDVVGFRVAGGRRSRWAVVSS